MKKLLIASAALAMVAGTAQAQSSVEVYGAVGASTNSYKTDGSDVANQFQNGARDHLSTTNLGFRGTEDLGGGNKAFFTLEGDLSMSGGLGANPAVPTISGSQGSEKNTASTVNAGQNTFNRQAHVGLTTKFGTVSFGRQNDSVKDTEGLAQVYNLSDNLHNNTAVGNRIANAYKYATPTIAGLSATYTYSNNPANLDMSAADGAVTHNSFAVRYKVPFNGGIDLAYAQGEESTTAGNTANDIKTTRISAQTKVMGATIGYAYTENKDKAAGSNKNDSNLISVNVPFMGAYEFKAHYITADAQGTVVDSASTGSDGGYAKYKGDGYGLMAVYNLSKRTAAYVGYASFDADDVAGQAANKNDQKVTTLGLVHKF
jgi:predicted porin